MAVRVERAGSKASCYIIKWTLRLAHGGHFIFMSAGLPIQLHTDVKEGLNKLFGRTVSKLRDFRTNNHLQGPTTPQKRPG